MDIQEQFETVVTQRDATHEKGLFKLGTEITIDINEMVAYHGGVEWNITCVEPLKKFKLIAFETYFDVIEVMK